MNALPNVKIATIWLEFVLSLPRLNERNNVMCATCGKASERDAMVGECGRKIEQERKRHKLGKGEGVGKGRE